MRPEHARVYRVHAGKFAHVDQEHPAAQHMLKVSSRRLQDRFHVAQARFGLRLDPVRHQAGDRIPGTLSGDENQSFERDSGRIRA